MTRVSQAWPNGRFVDIQSNLRRKKLHRGRQGSNFLGGSFSNGDNLRAPIQFRRESQPQHLTRWFFLKNRPIHFHINGTCVIRPVKQDWVFPALKPTSYFLSQSTESRQGGQWNLSYFKYIFELLSLISEYICLLFQVSTWKRNQVF